MGVCYIQMGRHLWYGDKSALRLLVPQAALTKSRNDKKKIVKMFAFVVVIFMVCWAPYHIYFIYCYHNPSVTSYTYIGHIYLGFYWLAMSNTCVNPIIYYWMNRRFRAYFNQVLCCVPNIISKTAKTQWNRQSQSVNKVKFFLQFLQSSRLTSSDSGFRCHLCTEVGIKVLRKLISSHVWRSVSGPRVLQVL